jgi:signal transduction histidine kinase
MNSFPGAISQILTNLIDNSLIHGLSGVEEGRIKVEAHIEESGAEEGSYVILEYTDNGRGLTPEEKERLFEPFFTTRRGSGGSGLGMHIVFNLVTQTLRGQIDCLSAPGRGIKFVLRLPVDLDMDAGE